MEVADGRADGEDRWEGLKEPQQNLMGALLVLGFWPLCSFRRSQVAATCQACAPDPYRGRTWPEREEASSQR